MSEWVGGWVVGVGGGGRVGASVWWVSVCVSE